MLTHVGFNGNKKLTVILELFLYLLAASARSFQTLKKPIL